MPVRVLLFPITAELILLSVAKSVDADAIRQAVSPFSQSSVVTDISTNLSSSALATALPPDQASALAKLVKSALAVRVTPFSV